MLVYQRVYPGTGKLPIIAYCDDNIEGWFTIALLTSIGYLTIVPGTPYPKLWGLSPWCPF
jgi:hypothetical protein